MSHADICCIPTRPAPRRAFSLIEILISIVILALGLLGLAAVFPVVVTQQRQASDGVQGASVERSVGSFLNGTQSFGRQSVVNTSGAARGYGVTPSTYNRTTKQYDDSAVDQDLGTTGWDGLRSSPEWSPVTGDGNLGPWFVPSPGGANVTTLSNGEMQISPYGNLTIGANGTGLTRLSVTERLMPRPYSADGAEPRYVWDMALRRVDAGLRYDPADPQTQAAALADDMIQIAIFVRRIDPNIRVPEGYTLSDVLSAAADTANPNRPAQTDWRVPVAADTQGRPALDGVGTGPGRQYSNIELFAVEIVEDRGQGWIEINPSGGGVEGVPTRDQGSQFFRYLRQLGQKFVDQYGTVQTVVEVDGTALDGAFRISPGLPPEAYQGAAAEGAFAMLGTPQIPASVSVVEVKPE